MDLSIKNMVCDRCILTVKNVFDENGIKFNSIDLGTVQTLRDLNELELAKLKIDLSKLGFEVLEDEGTKIVEAIKNAVIKLIQTQSESLKKYTISSFIEEEVGKDYKGLSTLFSTQENQTIEHFVIIQKVEKVKELLSYKEMSISEISDSLYYSSVAHLSNQFKKITGMTPSQFKVKGERTALDKI